METLTLVEKEVRNEQVFSQVVNDQVVTAPVKTYNGHYMETVEYVGCVKKNGHEDGMFETFREFAELDNKKWDNLQHSELVEEYHNAMKKLYENCDIKSINVYIGEGCKMQNCDKSVNYRLVLRAKFHCHGMYKTIVGMEWAKFLE